VKKKKLYVFGNRYLEFDSLGTKIAESFSKEISISYVNAPETLLYSKDKEITIIDVVRGIRKPVLIEGASRIRSRKIMSLHDFDLGFVLRLMHELGSDKKIKIIGVPQHGNAAEIAKEVRPWI